LEVVQVAEVVQGFVQLLAGTGNLRGELDTFPKLPKIILLANSVLTSLVILWWRLFFV